MLLAIALVVVGVVAALTVLGTRTWRPADPPPPPGGTIAVGDGRRMHVMELPGEEPPVVLLHGLPGSIRDWDAVLPLIGDRHRVALDRPGFGDTGGAPLTMRDQAKAVGDALEALDVGGAVLVGHSYGATLALTIARTRPALVSGVVLVAPMGGGRRMPLQMRMEARALFLVTAPGLGDLIRMTVGRIFIKAIVRRAYERAFAPSPVDPAWRRVAYSHGLRTTTLRSLYANRLDFDRDFGWLDRHLDQVRVPVSIVRAVDDRMVGSFSAVGLRDYLPNVVSYQECEGGHMLPVVRPEAVRDAIDAVTEAVVSRRPRA